MNYINFRTLYLDFLEDSQELSSQIRQRLIREFSASQDEYIAFIRLQEINELIRHDLSKIRPQNRIQLLKSYDERYIRYILNYQKTYRLSNVQIALEFKLSRNTIARWRKKY